MSLCSNQSISLQSMEDAPEPALITLLVVGFHLFCKMREGKKPSAVDIPENLHHLPPVQAIGNALPSGLHLFCPRRTFFYSKGGGTKSHDRTSITLWVEGGTDRCPQIHEGLVPAIGVLARQYGPGRGPNRLNGYLPGSIPGDCAGKQAGEYPDNIRIDNGDGFPKNETSQRMGCVTPDPRELLELLGAPGKFPTVLLKDHSGCLLKPEGAVVISHTTPCTDDTGGSGVREGAECRKALQKKGIQFEDAAYLCLLEHDFGDKDAVLVMFPPPGKVTAIPAIPEKKGSGNL